MPAVPFAELPDDARLWIFAASRPLTSADSEGVLERVDRFLSEWHAHGHRVVGSTELCYNQFLLVAADERATGVSGCSIDSLFHTLRDLEREIGITLTDSSLVFFRDRDGGIRSVSRSEFRALARAGEIGADTIVFDNTVATVEMLRAGRWEVPLRTSWHARAFPVATPAGG